MITDNIDIFISAHFNFNKYPNNCIYKIVCGENDDILNKTIPIIKERQNKYSNIRMSLREMSRIYWIWKNVKLKKYVGFCQYRKYFSFYDNTYQINNIINKLNSQDSSIITPVPYYYNKTYTSYNDFEDHFIIDDYILTKNIIHNLYNISYETLSQTEMIRFYHNMFIMKVEDFYNYCEFIFSIIDEFIKIRKFNTINDILNYINFNKHKINPTYRNDLNYEIRILAHLCEWITSIFFQIKFTNIIKYDVIIIDDKKYAKVKSIRRGI